MRRDPPVRPEYRSIHHTERCRRYKADSDEIDDNHEEEVGDDFNEEEGGGDDDDLENEEEQKR